MILLQERAEVTRLRRALSEATAAGEREYLDLEEQLAEAERSRAAAAAKAEDLEQQLRGRLTEQQEHHHGQEDFQQLQQQLQAQQAELEALRSQSQQVQDHSALQAQLLEVGD